MTEVVVEGLRKRFDGVVAVDGITFTVRSGELVTLLGPSGCGKTTTLNCIAGVALARALVYEPPILLLDEPLSNLDAKLREQARFWLRALQQRLRITTIYVTHDQAEALSLSDRVIVMNRGRIAAVGTPQEIYERPADPFVADFIGSCNFLRGTVSDREAQGRVRVRLADGTEVAASAPQPLQPGQAVWVAIRCLPTEWAIAMPAQGDSSEEAGPG